jgi:hypothetical protein
MLAYLLLLLPLCRAGHHIRTLHMALSLASWTRAQVSGMPLSLLLLPLLHDGESL